MLLWMNLVHSVLILRILGVPLTLSSLQLLLMNKI